MGDRLTSPVIVGRQRELGVLKAALEATEGGTPSVVILSGDAGVGKTRLIEEFLKHGRQAPACP